LSDRVRFRQADVTKAIKAARAAGLTTFDVMIGADGMPIIRVGDGHNDDLAAEYDEGVAAWDRALGITHD
jgi:hypothetical protein